MVTSVDTKAEQLQHTTQLNASSFKLHTTQVLQRHEDMTVPG